MRKDAEGVADVTNAALSDVYAELLPAVWRFVSARVPARADAEDVTSEVFTRALESWPRYDPTRGSAVAWVSGIARRTVADWFRERRPTGVVSAETLDCTTDADPAADLEDAELVADLRRALAGLGERERDALALRFAAELRLAEIAEILDASTGAVKMTLFRALMKLRSALAHELRTASEDEVMATSLEDAIASVLARRSASIPDLLLGRIVAHLAVLYRPEVPAEVRTRVEACIECGEPPAATSGTRPPARAFAGITVPSLGGLIQMLTAPACAVCAAAPVLSPLYVIGVGGALGVLHEGLWVLAPLNVALLWRNFRRHGRPTAVLLAAAGAALVLVHLTSHILRVPFDPAQLAFWASMSAIWAGVILLVAAFIVDRRVEGPRRAPAWDRAYPRLEVAK